MEARFLTTEEQEMAEDCGFYKGCEYIIHTYDESIDFDKMDNFDLIRMALHDDRIDVYEVEKFIDVFNKGWFSSAGVSGKIAHFYYNTSSYLI